MNCFHMVGGIALFWVVLQSTKIITRNGKLVLQNSTKIITRNGKLVLQNVARKSEMADQPLLGVHCAHA